MKQILIYYNIACEVNKLNFMKVISIQNTSTLYGGEIEKRLNLGFIPNQDCLSAYEQKKFTRKNIIKPTAFIYNSLYLSATIQGGSPWKYIKENKRLSRPITSQDDFYLARQV